MLSPILGIYRVPSKAPLLGGMLPGSSSVSVARPPHWALTALCSKGHTLPSAITDRNLRSAALATWRQGQLPFLPGFRWLQTSPPTCLVTKSITLHALALHARLFRTPIPDALLLRAACRAC